MKRIKVQMKKTRQYSIQTRNDHAVSWFKMDKWWIVFPVLGRKDGNLETDLVEGKDCTPWLEDSVLELSSKSPVDSTEEEEEMEG